MEEIWKDVVGYEGLYQVSNMGRVKSLPRKSILENGIYRNHKGKILKSFKIRAYSAVCLSKYSKRKTRTVHQLVAESFLGHTPCGHELVVDHINNNPIDNRLENLQIVTQIFNLSKKIFKYNDKYNGKYSSQYRGVSLHKASGKWVSNITINNVMKYIGLFETEYDAHLAYEEAVKKIESMKQNQ